MPYTNRPFNPNTPYDNQVETELELANDNFEILAQAFLNSNPMTGVLKSDVYTFRRVNLTGATSDYDLQIGEEAIINFTNATAVPLRIATQNETLYHLYVYTTLPTFAQGNGVSASTFLNPNNTTYAGAFYRAGARWNNQPASGTLGSTFNAFELAHTFPANSFVIIYNEIGHKSTISIALHGGADANNLARLQFTSCVWHDFTTEWTSLGTIAFPRVCSGYILVKRLA
jgi:hypothetical protein